ncbi:glucosamine-6-phosphate deaminase [bacterium]|nr:MAG: glucosamine-6-phosphate deaminase [bacterium]
MKTSIYCNYTELTQAVAARIAEVVRAKPDAVLGLATGSTPIGVYDELIRLHHEENLDFSRVSAFNLDEYFPTEGEAQQSYYRFMREKLFDHINIEPRNCFIPSGEPRSMGEIERDCAAYEAEIAARGGLDLQLLGIGRTGHIGFNEPGSAADSRTRLVVLDHLTRADAASDFFGIENVPIRAITMGIATILEAREIVLMASSSAKAAIVAEALEGKITSKVPASFVRQHPNIQVFLDDSAAENLTQRAQPWRVPDADFRVPMLRNRTLMSVALERGKTLEEISRHDLAASGAAPLALTDSELSLVKSEVSRDLMSRIDDDSHLPTGKTVLCLSPHPDDDVICCGATLLKLSARGNRVFVAFGVNGANAVRDKDVLAMLRARHPRLISYIEEHSEPGKSFEQVFDDLRTAIFEREPGQPDVPLLRELKRLVREGEASDACRKMGAKPLFWNLPFYNENREIGEDDVQIALDTLCETQPDLVLLTGEFNDPHGTHEKCGRAFERAAHIYVGKENGKAFEKWNYRGAWDEWPLWQGDVFSVFDKEMMEKKIGLILDHISQLDPLFPGGNDPREFFERARDRNRDTARQLQKLGLLPPSRSFAPLYAEVFRRQS